MELQHSGLLFVCGQEETRFLLIWYNSYPCFIVFPFWEPLTHTRSLEKERSRIMETLREIVPFLIGLVLPVVMMLLSRAFHLKRLNTPLSFVLALLVGGCVSFFAGELAGDLPEALMAIIIDTSLVYTGSQAAYYLLWKPLLAHRLSSESAQTKSQIS
jgi:hypothetical protein